MVIAVLALELLETTIRESPVGKEIARGVSTEQIDSDQALFLLKPHGCASNQQFYHAIFTKTTHLTKLPALMSSFDYNGFAWVLRRGADRGERSRFPFEPKQI
jgi:hypothetical protein